jgi:hypothetical protein
MFKSIRDYFEYRSRKKMLGSDKPHFTMDVIKENADGTEVSMDWNDAFIKQLRDKGYSGITDEEVIEGYLYRIFERAHLRNVVRENIGKELDDDE